jgi:glycerol-3-phosphate dehydrogenase (NAD(P)+)
VRTNIYVIGGGAWGTALAQAAADAGREVALVVRSFAQADAINTTRRNASYLGDQPLSERIVARADWEGIDAADLVLMVTPAQTTRAVISAIGAAALAGKSVVLCAKGLEANTLGRQSEILKDIAPDAKGMVLSGPSFAADVAAGRPTAVTLAGEDPAATATAAGLLASKSFRPYTGDDVIGVELAGGLKNIYALACGAVEGAGLGFSARSALIARAYAEMSRLVVALGGRAATLTGLAGLGDLTLSCTTAQSRNYWFGAELGAGRTVKEIEAAGAKLAEGVKTAPAALALAAKTGVDVPLIGAVNMLLAGTVNIDAIVAGLMSRPLKREGEN